VLNSSSHMIKFLEEKDGQKEKEEMNSNLNSDN